MRFTSKKSPGGVEEEIFIYRVQVNKCASATGYMVRNRMFADYELQICYFFMQQDSMENGP